MDVYDAPRSLNPFGVFRQRGHQRCQRRRCPVLTSQWCPICQNLSRGHQHPHRHGPNRPESLGAAIANLRGTGLPWRQVLALVAANMRRKVVSRSACCAAITANPAVDGR